MKNIKKVWNPNIYVIAADWNSKERNNLFKKNYIHYNQIEKKIKDNVKKKI
jgi:hypothetical protein